MEARESHKWEEAVEMVDFAVTVCEEQLRAGRHFVFEHPLSASSWKLPSLKKLMKRSETLHIVSHVCAFGMNASDTFGEAAVVKPTRLLTNFETMYGRVSARCFRDCRHVHSDGRNKAKAAINPHGLIDAV